MLKKLIARILVLALLVQCVPVEAVAEAGNSLLLSQQELDRLSAEYDLESMDDYHDGMAYSDSFNLEQTIGYLYYLQYAQIEPLSNTIEMLIDAIAKVGPQPDVEQYKLATLDAFMFNLHKIKDEITGCLDALEESVDAIHTAADRVWDTEYYTFSQRAGYSSRVKKAQDRIAATRAEISQKRASWEENLENSEQAIRNDGTMDVQVSAANDGSFVTFTPRSEGVQGARSGDWQLRDLYAELKSSSAPQFFTVSTADLGLKSAPSLLQRLSPVTTAYADRQQDATVTVIDDNQFAVEARDENGAPIVGMTVRAIDVDKMYEDGPHTFVEAVTDENGAAVFDIPGNFTLDVLDKLNLYIEYPSGTGTLVRGAQGDTQPGHQGAYLWNVYIDRGTSYQYHLAPDVGEPYVASVSYNSQDVTQNIATFYYAAGSDITHRCFVKIGNADTDTGAVRLRYTSAEEKDGDGQYAVKETAALSLTPSEDGYATAEIKGPFGHMFLPGQPIYLVYEDAAHAGDNALVQALNVDIEAGQLPAPYDGTMKPFDINTSILFNCALPYDFSIFPGTTNTAPSFGLDMPLNIPRVSVTFVPHGSISATLGFEFPGDYWVPALHWNKQWPARPEQEPPVENTEGGPERPTEENSETGGAKHGRLWQFFCGKVWDRFGEKWENMKTVFSPNKGDDLSYPGKVLNHSVQFEPIGGFVGTIQNLGEDPEKGTLAVLNASASAGMQISWAGEWSTQYPVFFWGLGWSIEATILYSWGLAQDLHWKTKDNINSTVDAYDLDGKMRSVSSNNIINFMLKVQGELFGGIGLHGFAEVSIHGYIYLAFNVAYYTNGTDKVSPPYKLQNPHFTISFGGGLYILLKFVILRVRFDLLPKELEKNFVFFSTWPNDIDLDFAPGMRGYEQKLRKEAGMPQLSLANPALRAARAEEAEAEETQDYTSLPTVYNSDLLVDTTTPILKGLEVLGGRVSYARISGGKYKNPSRTPNDDASAVHTYAFFLVPNEDDKPRLSYIDLDAKSPTVFTFDEQPSYARINDGKTWNADAETNDTRAADYNNAPYDYDFAVTSVADYNRVPGNAGASYDGMSAVVCVLSSTELNDVQMELGDETSSMKVAAKQQGGDIYTTVFVATRIDNETGRLSMVTSNVEGNETNLSCTKSVSRMIYYTPDQYEGPEITAAYENKSFGTSPMQALNCNAGVYTAAVMFQPRNAGNKDNQDDGPSLRYRSRVNDEDKWNTVLSSQYKDDEMDQVFRGVTMKFLYMARENWEKRDADGVLTWMPTGKTLTQGLLPFPGSNTDVNISWIETRGFKDNDNAQLVLYSEQDANNDYVMDWTPLSPASLDSLIGREGTGVLGHVTPWNADPNSDVAFFFYGDQSGNTYLDSVRLSDGVLTDYDVSVPPADLNCVDAGGSIIFYWPASHTPADLENGEKGPCYSIKSMVYEKASGVLFSPMTLAEIDTDEDTPPTRPFMTEEGACYFALEGKSTEEIEGTGVSTTKWTTTLDFFKFEPQYTMGVEFLSADFAEGAVHQGAYDDILMLIRNNGNVPISGFTLEVYDVDDNGNEALMETIDANLSSPADSFVTYTGLADGNARTETGEKVVSVTGNDKTQKRAEWAVVEATPNRPADPSVLPSKWDVESTYLSTNSLMPLDMATLESPILIGATWKGTHRIRFKIKQLRSPNAWAVDLEGNEMRAARNAARNGANALRDTREVAITRLDNGLAAVHYADEAPQTGSLSLIDTLLGREAPSAPPHYNASIAFDEIDLDTAAEDLTLDMRHYIRPSDGMEMVQLTAHNVAHEDSEPKCVVLYAYGDYSYDDVWFVCDFGDLNAGEAYTVTLPLDAIVAGHNVNTLLLDLHIDHDEARRHGTATTNHSHDGSEIYNGCQHDVNAFNDYVEIKLDDDILQIVKQPADFSTVTGGTASFSVSVRGGTLPYSYQWQVRKPLYDKDGKHLLDETGNWKYGDWVDWMEGDEITLETLASADMNGWQFHVIVTDMSGRSVTSAFATLRLTDVPMTGDEAQPILWAALALAALVTAILVLATRKKRRKRDATK